MKIKIKVKNIILLSLGILLFIFAVIPYGNLLLADVFSDKNPTIANKLYNNYLKYPTGLRRDEALYKGLENIVGGFKRHNIMLGMKLGGDLIDEKTMIDVVDKLEEILNDYPKSEYYDKAYKGILDSYIFLGDAINLEKWIDFGKSHENSEVKELSMLYNSYNQFISREYDEAEEILNSFTLNNSYLDYIYYFLKGHIEFSKENFENSLEYYKKAQKLDVKYRVGSFFGTFEPYSRREWLETLDYIEGDNKIKGRITSDGVGIPFIEIYLKYPDGGYRSTGGNFIAITDKDGYYESIGVKDGRYEIGIGIGSPLLYNKVYLDKTYFNIDISKDIDIDFQLVTPMEVVNPKTVQITKDNKFTVEWNEVEGAEFYSVSTVGFDDPFKMEGSRMTVTIPDINGDTKLKGNKAVFDLDVIKDSGMGFYLEGDEDIISHHAILGYFNKEIETPIIVSAYDKDWSILSSTMPLIGYYENLHLPRIKVEGILSKGERLILDKDYVNAIEFYEEILSQDEYNTEALEYLTRIYSIGWKKGMKNLDKAFEYGFRLSNIRGDRGSILAILNSMNSEDKRQYKDTIRDIFKSIPEVEMTPKAHGLRGEYYRSNGEFEKAREDLEKSGHYYVAQDIIFIDLYLGENQRAIEKLQDKETKLFYMSKEKLIEAIEILDKLDKNHKEYIRFREYIHGLLMREDKYEERFEKFRDVLNNTKNKGIKTILYEIKIDNHW